jgi:hypothetical protein
MINLSGHTIHILPWQTHPISITEAGKHEIRLGNDAIGAQADLLKVAEAVDKVPMKTTAMKTIRTSRRKAMPPVSTVKQTHSTIYRLSHNSGNG